MEAASPAQEARTYSRGWRPLTSRLEVSRRHGHRRTSGLPSHGGAQLDEERRTRLASQLSDPDKLTTLVS